jgi:hypothetical protein
MWRSTHEAKSLGPGVGHIIFNGAYTAGRSWCTIEENSGGLIGVGVLIDIAEGRGASNYVSQKNYI